MTVYIAYLVFAFVISCMVGLAGNCSKSTIRWTRIAACALCCLALIVIVGLRSVTLGADTKIYLDALHYYSGYPADEVLGASLVWPYDFEPGYFLLTKICALFNLSDTAFLVLIAVCIYAPVFIFIYKYSDNLFLSILVYFGLSLFAYSMGIFRQMIAISICLCALPFLFERKAVAFFGIIAFAATFHISSVLFATLWFYRCGDLRKLLVAAILVSVLFLVFGRIVVMAMVRIMPSYAGYIGSSYDVRGGTYAMYAVWITIALIAVNYLKLAERLDEEIPSIIQVALFSLALLLCVQASSYSMGIMGRITGYLSIFQLALIPFLTKYALGKEGFVLCLYGFALVFAVLTYQSLNGLPFSFFWQ